MPKPKSKPKKVRRVVLGVGHPWFYYRVKVGGEPRNVGLILTKTKNYFQCIDAIDSNGLGHWNKIRLVAEVLK